MGEIGDRVLQAGGGEALNCTARQEFVHPWWAPWVEYLEAQHQTPECVARYYEGLREEVERVVPRQKLLQFNVKQGWVPLCTFLNVSVPDQPFPHVNSTRELIIAYWFLRAVCWIYPAFLLGPVLCCACSYRR